jgi:hypothetical protein
MTKIYQYLEFTLLTLLLIRFIVAYFRGFEFDIRLIEIPLFYFIWYSQCIITWIIPNTLFAFNFVHCTFPIVLSGVMLVKKQSLNSYVYILLVVILNIYFHNRRVIEITYILTYALVLIRMHRLNFLNKKSRELIPIYGVMLAVLIITHLIYMFGYVKINWSGSHYVNYFFYLVIITYLTSLSLIHVQFRRFLTY